MKYKIYILFFLFCAFISAEGQYVCGVAEGYPPFQFENSQGVAGFDVEVARVIFSKLEKQIKFEQGKWDDIVGRLYFSNTLDMICGMEISGSRRKRFIFSRGYYKRKSVIFVLKENKEIINIQDLIGKNITGDRDSYTEKIMLEQGLLDKIRIKQTKNKSESFDLLKEKKYVAVIAPKAVGTYLAKQKGIQVKVIEIGDPGIDVGLAFRKEDITLKNEVDKVLLKLLNDGTIELLKKEWNIK